MERDRLKQQGTTAVLEYSRGNKREAKQEFAGVVYELLNEAFPEMEKSRQRSHQGQGFLTGVLAGIVVYHVLGRRLLGRDSRSE